MSLQTRISDLITAVGTDIKQLRTWITGSASGDLTGLDTTDKTSVVAAINETLAAAGAGAADASETVKGIAELATLAEVATGTDTTRIVTPAGVKQETDAVKAAILDSAPAALDTLNELAAALGDDANYAATINTALGVRLRVDTAAQGLDGTQQSNGRTNLDVYGTNDLGDPDTDLSALYTTAKS